jgi:hypothetical protein
MTGAQKTSVTCEQGVKILSDSREGWMSRRAPMSPAGPAVAPREARGGQCNDLYEVQCSVPKPWLQHTAISASEALGALLIVSSEGLLCQEHPG